MNNTEKTSIGFDEQKALINLKHYLPAQAPLKDFIHHNTLHAFQDKSFHKALRTASEIFGYKVYLGLDAYRAKYKQGEISEQALDSSIIKQFGSSQIGEWKKKLINGEYNSTVEPEIGKLRHQWKTEFKINLDKSVHPVLFRLLNNYLDQGISINGFPLIQNGFLASVRELERNSYISLFKTKEARNLLLNPDTGIGELLYRIVGKEELFERYLFDQQFAHPGWSGMVAVLESEPGALLDHREISLKELIILELILESDALYAKFGELWKPLATDNDTLKSISFDAVVDAEKYTIFMLWQEAFEWTYYNSVIRGISDNLSIKKQESEAVFHAFFCIDDRECSLRRHIEHLEPGARTYGTPGFFNVEFYFQPEHSKFNTKVCPAPLFPGHIIKETENTQKREQVAHFTKHSHSLLTGWLIAQTLGFWSALKLFVSIFRPTIEPASSYSFRHMDNNARLSIENTDGARNEDGLQIGFSIAEMCNRMEGLFKSTGLTMINTPLVYFVGHGASSINNTHYAGYDCGACSGRPGSVNARVAAYMANHPEVRKQLASWGIQISNETRFIGALHDTTRDEIEFYDEASLNETQISSHLNNKKMFAEALDNNAKERSRRFILTNTLRSAEKVHQRVKLRSVSLFEPRPELNHATNSLCIVGRREISKDLFLDRRAFMNSYDHRVDPDGRYLFNIMNAVAPVCGGINLEYYFSRTDNYRLGAGSKLPHNVMGLLGVANGTDGDLRTGLPLQMIEVHDPIRLLVIVECKPEILLEVIKRSEATYEWFRNHWIHLLALDPDEHGFHLFNGNEFELYEVHEKETPICRDLNRMIEKNHENIEVMLLEEHKE